MLNYNTQTKHQRQTIDSESVYFTYFALLFIGHWGHYQFSRLPRWKDSFPK